jgi:hypothetical protein
MIPRRPITSSAGGNAGQHKDTGAYHGPDAYHSDVKQGKITTEFSVELVHCFLSLRNCDMMTRSPKPARNKTNAALLRIRSTISSTSKIMSRLISSLAKKALSVCQETKAACQESINFAEIIFGQLLRFKPFSY